MQYTVIQNNKSYCLYGRQALHFARQQTHVDDYANRKKQMIAKRKKRQTLPRLSYALVRFFCNIA